MAERAPGRELADAEERRRIREELQATFFVEAAAGTGKTSALVSRIVALVRSGTGRLDRIAAVTFTEKAAGEMKLRLRSDIESARADPEITREEEQRLDQALSHLELARIGTIHAFCGDLLHERPIEAGVDPLFEVAATEESDALLDRAFEAWFQRVLSDPPEGIRRVLRRRPKGRGRVGPRELLRGAVASLVEHRDFATGWRIEPFDREGEMQAVMAQLAELGALAGRAGRKDDWLGQALERIRLFCEENQRREAVHGPDPDGLEAELREFGRASEKHWTWKGSLRQPYGRDLPRKQVLEQRDAVQRRLDELLARSEANLAAHLREDLREVVVAYEAEKKAAGRLDFLDLLVRARDLIRRDASVRGDLQRRFTHFFVDEFQDTDPLQAEILVLLAADDPSQADWREARPVPGKLFLVGDPKQSIYRFRRADVSIYEGAKRLLVGRGAEVLHLSTSFRSLPSIQQAVNAAFEPRMQPDEHGTQARYVALQPYREDTLGRPTVVALPVPRPYSDYGQIRNWPIERSFPDATGAFVHWLIEESGWTIEAPDGSGRREKIRARHVCLLFRRFKSFGEDVTRPYVRALEARRVPHVLVGGRSFHEREEVVALRNAVAAIEWPDDELSVFATLRGPFFALGDDALLAYRNAAGSLRRALAPEEAAGAERAVAEAIRILRRLHRQRNRRPIAETIAALLAELRAHAGIAIWPTGEQALANTLRVVDLARRFERRGAASFRAFVRHLESEAERGEAEDAPVVEEGTEGVRIMTVHRAKGLEFPVVILADPTANAVSRNPSRHIDADAQLWAEPLCGCTPHELKDAADDERARDAEESVRVAYVAATRARELLVVPAVGDEELPGWLDILNPVVYPPASKRRDSGEARGCPRFGEDSVLDRGPRGVEDVSRSVRPGMHQPRAGGHSVVWWDPRALALDQAEEVGLRQQKILVADDGDVAQASTVAHAAWQSARADALAAGRVPSLDVRSVTSLAHAELGEGEQENAGHESAADADVDVEVVRVDADRGARPGGRRFGTLVHAILAEVPLPLADPAQLEAIAVQQGRLIGAAAGEVEAAVTAARGALDHPLMRRAAAAALRGELRRETPVLMQRDDGVLVEGIVDLAFRESAAPADAEGAGAGRGAGIADPERAWTVVDFKTDRELGDALAPYCAQLRLYAQAIEAATLDPARAVLFQV